MDHFKPSNVYVLAMPPLTACFRKTEAECAAAMLVWYMQTHGDTWQRVSDEQMEQALMECVGDPVRAWDTSPFFRPDVERLVMDGYVTGSGRDGWMFTEQGLNQMRNSPWVRP